MHARWLWGVVAAGLLIGCGPGGANQTDAVGSERLGNTYTTQGPGGRWLYTVAGWQDDSLLALTTDPSGATIALIADSSYATPPNLPTIVLRKLNSGGYLVWERVFQNTAPIATDDMATDAAGNIYILWRGRCFDPFCYETGTIDFGGGPLSVGSLVKLDPTGAFLWQVSGPRQLATTLAVNPNGEAAFHDWNVYDERTTLVMKTRSDGTIAWTTPMSDNIYTVGIDPSGNVLVGLGGPAVAKLAASNGTTLWSEVLAVGGYVTGIRTSALGTIVVAARVQGAFSFAGQSFNTTGDPNAACLMVLEPNGEQRFARRLPDSDSGWVRLAVDPPGKVSLVGNWPSTSSRRGFTVTWYNLAGDYIGQLDFPASTASGNLWADAIAIAADHSTVVGGHDLGVTSGSVFGATGSVATAGTGQHVFIVGGLFRINGPSFIDEFNRTFLGPNWNVTEGTFIDDGSAARGTSFGSYAFWTGVPGPNDTAEVAILPSRNLGAITRGDFNDPDRNHYVGYVDSSGYIRIARRRDWVYSYLAIGRLFPSGSHRLSITATGSAPVRLAVQLDDTTVLTYNDYSTAAITGGGRVGMFDYNGLSQPIDRFRVIRH